MNAPLSPHHDPYLPFEAEILERRQETATVFTLRLRFTDPCVAERFRFQPGQFNMLYLFGGGEVAISISSDPSVTEYLDHTIRAVGRVTRAMTKLSPGDRIGIRGPYGRPWPMDLAHDKDVYVITGGLGCAPVVSVIEYVLRRREQFGKLTILQGVKHSGDMVYRQRYDIWRQAPNVEVFLAADEGGDQWPWHTGYVTDLVDNLAVVPERAIVMACGPEIMMHKSLERMMQRGVPPGALYLSMERNMHCAIGHCGHCQYGGKFVCKDGPVFCYPDVQSLFGIAGF